MQAKSSLAVVLKVLPQREDDLLCDLLTREWGRVWGVARSARKSRKRFGTLLAPFNILRIGFEERKSSVVFLREASLAVSLSHLQEGLERLGTAFYLAESIREITPERLPEPKKFELLAAGLQALNRGEDPVQVKHLFNRSLLRLAGLEPHLTGCLRCGVQQEHSFFVFREGGIFCPRCLPAGIEFEPVKVGEEERLFTPFLEYCMGKRLKSKVLC